MPQIEFAEVDIYGSPKLKARVAELVGSEFGGTQSADSILRMIDFASGTTKVMGGFVGDELVSMNAFMRMPFRRDDEVFTGFQSGFSATDTNHRGKGYWPRLMTFAEAELARSGASFIFGFPNPVSHPLFVKKLRYTSLELYNRRIVCAPLVFGNAFTAAASKEEHALRPDVDDNIGWKTRSDEAHAVVVVTSDAGTLWGKVRERRKYGVPLKYLEIGSFELRPGGQLRDLFRLAARRAKVRLIYVSMNPENLYFPLIRFHQYGQPIIIKPLADFDPGAGPLNIFGGLRDTF